MEVSESDRLVRAVERADSLKCRAVPRFPTRAAFPLAGRVKY